MKSSLIQSVLIAASLLISASVAGAAAGETSQRDSTDSKSFEADHSQAFATRAAPDKKAAKIKLVDINSASKAELKKLPGIGAAEADKIIAGRPYLSKAFLVTKNIIPEKTYWPIRHQIVAKQKLDAQGRPIMK